MISQSPNKPPLPSETIASIAEVAAEDVAEDVAEQLLITHKHALNMFHANQQTSVNLTIQSPSGAI
jgi:hypothetical protein